MEKAEMPMASQGCGRRRRSYILQMVPWLVLLLLAPYAAGEEPGETEEVECGGEEERSFDSEVRVAKFQYEEFQVQLFIIIFVIIAVFAKMVWHHHTMQPVSSNIPESCMLIVVGAYLGGLLLGLFYLEDDCHRQNELDPPFRFTPNLFFLYLLPPIVLEAGYFMNNRAFFENISTILVYAVVGTIFNAFAIGLCLYGLFHAGVLLTGADVNFTISSALLFGTITAAVDPVAVLAVFEEIHVNKALHILVFGESLLNDAVTIVLFQVLGAFANRPLDPHLEDNDRAITFTDGLLGVGQFLVVVGASLVIGVLFGAVGALFTRFTAHVHVLEPIVVFAIAYLSYLVADLFAFSGIVSLIATAIFMRDYVEANISRNSHTTIKYSIKVFSNVAEMIIFLFLGISLYDTAVHFWDTGLVLWTLVLVLLFRPIGVVLLTLIINIFRVRKIGWKSMFIMSYSGLRGAVAFSLALVRITEETEEFKNPHDQTLSNELKLRQSMLTAITVLVLFTVFIQGTTIKPIVRWLRIRTEKERKLTMNDAIHGTALDHITAGMEDIVGHVGHNRIRETIRDFDFKYLRKIFERYPEARDEKILHTFKRLQFSESAKAAEQYMTFKWHTDRDEDKRVSFYPTTTPTDVPEPQEPTEPGLYEDKSELEDHIPVFNDILQATFISPHESHFSHVLPRNERDDHHHRLEPSATARRIHSQHQRRQRRRKLGNKIRNSVFFRSPAHQFPEKEEEEASVVEGGYSETDLGREDPPEESKMAASAAGEEKVEVEVHTQSDFEFEEEGSSSPSSAGIGPIPVSTGPDDPVADETQL